MIVFDLVRESRDFSWRQERHRSVDALVTPALAGEIVARFNYSGQRPRRERHSQALAEAMRCGSFREYTSVDFAVLDGTPHLINGQHTLHAIIESQKSIWLSVHLNEAESEQAIEEMYSKYDVGRTRSLRDVMGSLGEEIGLTKTRERDALAAATKWIIDDFRCQGGSDSAVLHYKRRDFELKKELMREWAEEARDYFEFIRSAPSSNVQLFWRGAVVAVALVTFRFSGEKAAEFWGGAAADDGLRNGDPRKALINWLRSNPVGRAQNVQHRAAVSCWNAWYRGGKLTKVHTDSKSSLQISGTPYPCGDRL